MIGENGFENIVWFIGLVEDNSDLNGRVRVRAFGFHPPVSDGTVATSDLPWAHVVRDSKVITPFDNGDMVVGFFMDGRDAQHPVVIGAINSAKFSSPTTRALAGQETTFRPEEVGPGYCGTERAKFAYNYFIQRGFTPQQAAGIVGNLQAESGPSLTNTYNPNDLGQPSYGIAQWRGSRAEDFREIYGMYPNEATLDQQLEFIMYEFNTTESGAYNAIRGTTTAAEAAEVFDRRFERSDGSTISSRISNAESLLEEFSGAVMGDTSQFENPYLAPSQDAVDNFGRPALPPQMTGEDIEQTPALIQASTRRTVQFSSGYSSSEPSGPSRGHVTNTSVWHTRYGGSNITMSGKNTSDEYIDISHASGSRVTLDGNGNITIKAMGKVYIGSEDMIEESSEGFKLAHHGAGYALEVTSGKVQIISAGDVEISSHANMTLNAGGRLILNAGDSIDMAGSRIAATARVDAIDLVAAGKMALHSQKTGLSINSTEGMFIQSGKKLSVKSGEDMIIQSSQNLGMKAEDNIGVQSVGGTLGLKSMGSATIASSVNVGFNASGLVMVKGSAIHLNSPGIDPDDVPDSDDAEETLSALSANVPDPIPLKTVGESKATSRPSDISSDMVDDTV